MNSNLTPVNDIDPISGASEADLVAQKLKACGDSLRVQILQCLRSDAFGVLELTQIFDTKQSGMSHHLKVLSKAGLVEAQREGNSIFYRRPVQSAECLTSTVCAKLFDILDSFVLDPIIERRTDDIRTQREAQSKAFFSRNADRFSEQQELICEHAQYAQTSFDLLAGSVTGDKAKVLEIGPGEGLFLELLTQRYADIEAVDTSAVMLEKATRYCAEKDLSNIALTLGSTDRLVSENKQYDGIAMNMVLHHVPTPAALLKDCAKLLVSGGTLVLCDLSHHNQEWTKQNCGDLWLGFEQSELASWANAAGFTEDKSVFIGLRNGFQIQIYRYIKR